MHGDVIVAPDGNLYRLCGRETISRRILAELLDRWDTSESGVRLGKGYRKVAWQEDALQRVGAFGLVHWTATEDPDVVRAGLGHPLPLADMPPGNRKQHRQTQYNGQHPNGARKECEMASWLDKLTWTDGVFEPDMSRKIPYRQADVTPYYQRGVHVCEAGELSICVVLTEWPQSYSLDVYGDAVIGDDFEPWDAVRDGIKVRIFKIPRIEIFRQSREWWAEQRMQVNVAIRKIEREILGGWRGDHYFDDDFDLDPQPFDFGDF